MPLPWFVRLAGLALLLAGNGFFVAAEFSLVTLRQSRVEELLAQGARGAGALARLRRRVDDLLSAAQLGETLSALGLGWAAGPTLGAGFDHLLPQPASIHARAVLLAGCAVAAFLLVTAADIVLAELVPKYLALRYSENLALALAPPLEAFIRLTAPFLRAISGAARLVLRALAGSAAPLEGAHSAEEIKLLVNSSLRLGELEPFQADIVERVLNLRRTPVRELMTPRLEIQALNVETPLETALQFVTRHGRSRIPVMAGSLDHLIGLLDTRELLAAWQRLRQRGRADPLRELTLRALLRPLPVVPESKTVGSLLAEFQSGKTQMAAVVDEFGTVTGLVTLHDLLGQIVGEIRDHAGPSTPPPEPAAGSGGGAFSAELPGLTGIRELESQYRLRFPRDDSYETLAGFLLSRLGYLPNGGEQVALGPYRFTILAMNERRIAWVRMERIASATGDDARVGAS